MLPKKRTNISLKINVTPLAKLLKVVCFEVGACPNLKLPAYSWGHCNLRAHLYEMKKADNGTAS